MEIFYPATTSNWSRRLPVTFAVALDNAQLYSSLEQKALEIARLKDFSENIVESLNVGVLSVDLDGIVESWNTRMEQLSESRAKNPSVASSVRCCPKN